MRIARHRQLARSSHTQQYRTLLRNEIDASAPV
jgi:hypothetical protein